MPTPPDSTPTDASPEPPLRWLGFGAVRPDGWLKRRIEYDVSEGIAGHLERLAPDVMQHDDLYGRNRRTRATEHAGTDVSPHAVAWWNSESQSNAWDGLVRGALLTGHEPSLERVRAWVAAKLATQDEDGYLGIHAPDLRHRPDNENGDLWAQTTLFRALLAYAEATGSTDVLDAVRRAVDRTMTAWPADASSPFRTPGVGHSVVFADVLRTLDRLTGDPAYLDYAVWLVRDFNAWRDEDACVCNLLGMRPFMGHGVQAYELVRPIVVAWRATGDPELRRAIDRWLAKTRREIAPSGGPSGDEWVAGREADASEVGYEYCSIHELLDSYRCLLVQFGDLGLADRIEWLLFNAAQGARHPDGRSIAYCKTDNSASMTGPLHPDGGAGAGVDPATGGADPQRRFKYSPVHQDVAVCCAPNAGRIHPYYVEAMWLGRPDGLLLALYGPNALRTTIEGMPVTIRQVTRYPFEHSVTMIVEPDAPVAFSIELRRPEWATSMRVNGKEVVGQPVLRRTWKKGDRIRIEFATEVRMPADSRGDRLLTWGPLAFALPIPGRARVIRRWEADFVDRTYLPTDRRDERWVLPDEVSFALRRGRWSDENPWRTLALEGMLRDAETGEDVPARLVPLGATILRRLTFGPADST